jgi:hypothetical protein
VPDIVWWQKFLPTTPLTSLRIVRRSDPRHQQKLGIGHREGRKYDDVGRLFVLLAGYAINVANAGHSLGLAIIKNIENMRLQTQFEALALF